MVCSFDIAHVSSSVVRSALLRTTEERAAGCADGDHGRGHAVSAAGRLHGDHGPRARSRAMFRCVRHATFMRACLCIRNQSTLPSGVWCTRAAGLVAGGGRATTRATRSVQRATRRAPNTPVRKRKACNCMKLDAPTEPPLAPRTADAIGVGSTDCEAQVPEYPRRACMRALSASSTDTHWRATA